MSFQANQGTQTPLYTTTNGGTEIGIFKLDVGAGTNLADFGGTIRDVSNIAKGTITAIANGTISAGTFRQDNTPIQLGTPITVIGTAGAASWGTLVAAAGVGTKQYVSRVSIVVQSGTVDVAVTNIGVTGSAGAGVLERGQFPAGGGITDNYNPVIPSATNGTLAYWLGGAGTVAITINYWQGV